MGEQQKAVGHSKKLIHFPEDRIFVDSLQIVYQNEGMEVLLRKIYEYSILVDEKGSWRGLASYCIETGDKEKALDWLEKGWEWKISSFPL